MISAHADVPTPGYRSDIGFRALALHIRVWIDSPLTPQERKRTDAYNFTPVSIEIAPIGIVVTSSIDNRV